MNQEVEKLADELEKVLKSVKGCCGEYLVPEYSDRWQVAEAVIKAGYLPVEEAHLEVLEDEEIRKAEREKTLWEVGGIINWGKYEDLPGGGKARDGHIMSEAWEALLGGIA